MEIKLSQQSDPTIASVVYNFNLVKQFEELVRKSPAPSLREAASTGREQLMWEQGSFERIKGITKHN